MPVFTSSTVGLPDVREVPRHVAIIMDGNGRWATSRLLPRVAGHAKGVEAVRNTVEACARRGVEFLTLFAFSSENWRRPPDEVSLLMRLFMTALQRELAGLTENGIRLRVVGDLSAFEPRIRELVEVATARPVPAARMTLTVAANYGGRWDLLQAMRAWQAANPGAAPEALTEDALAPYLSTAFAPEPDLLIRTGGEARISNFMLWQLAYTELYFTEVLWPAFSEAELELAINSYAQRDRRFGGGSADKPQKVSA